ncbi:hypothetical protein SAMN02745181_1026 [Rubritalea squalenifaciens DSM 18772]|uniref:Capsule polysaccharide biosynthesis protein n=1 Tax=Rubritalea squalenifaciens DSM 18772 TaxID=1123071 RepID=A0A1M6EH74_9BACT|nr:hypothetical protein [Rubritalea squalenifaciens]SHI84670.1 hypothetical protein SAMN02745181_1026 [Rubritalea squalenifaciens DSM 18772]
MSLLLGHYFKKLEKNACAFYHDGRLPFAPNFIIADHQRLFSGFNDFHKPEQYSRYIFFAAFIQMLGRHHKKFDDIQQDIEITWAGKSKSLAPVRIIGEHGWLPRSGYQICTQGSNSRRKKLFTLDEPKLPQFITIDDVKEARDLSSELYDHCTPEIFRSLGLPDHFYLVALQTGDDFNLKYSDTDFTQFYNQENSSQKVAQAIADYLDTNRASPDDTFIFCPHPRARDISLKLQRKDCISHSIDPRLSFRDLARTPNCMGVISINSNAIHESMLLEKNVFTLGSLLYTRENSPFGTSLKEFFERCKRKELPSRYYDYLNFVIQEQCSVSELFDWRMWRRLLDEAIASNTQP